MKWWGVFLLIIGILAVGAGAFFLGRIVYPEVPTVVEAAGSEEQKSDKKESKKEESKDEKKAPDAVENKKKSIAPTLPRLRRYLKPAHSRDIFSQRYAQVQNSPQWRAQTGYGPPADVHDQIFSHGVLLGREQEQKSPVKRFVPLFHKQKKAARYQVELGSFISYKKALQRMKACQEKMQDPLVICDMVDREGRVRYSVRLRAPMSREQAHDYIGYCVEVGDVVAKVVPYSF